MSLPKIDEKVYTDKFNRPIKPGDILKVFHFKAIRRNIYMYKQVYCVDKDRKINAYGDWLYCFGLMDAYRQRGNLNNAHRCPLHFINKEDIEIIDGEDYWWERKKVNTEKEGG